MGGVEVACTCLFGVLSTASGFPAVLEGSCETDHSSMRKLVQVIERVESGNVAYGTV